MADAMDVDGPVGPVTKGPKGKTAVAGKEGVERFTVKKVSDCFTEPFAARILEMDVDKTLRLYENSGTL